MTSESLRRSRGGRGGWSGRAVAKNVVERMVSASVHLPRNLIVSLDALAARRRVSRNRLIAEACERFVRDDLGEWPKGFFAIDDLSAAELRTLRAAGRQQEGVIRRRRNRREMPVT